MRYRVTFSPEADAQLVNIHRYIAETASAAIAKRFVDAVVDHCDIRYISTTRFPARRFAAGIVCGGVSASDCYRVHG